MEGALGSVLCKLVWITANVSSVVSVLSMVAIAVERFYAVLYSLKPALISQRTCRVIIIATWVCFLMFRAHYLYALKLVRSKTSDRYFFMMWWRSLSKTQEVLEITWISLVCLTSLSAIVPTVLYSGIAIFLYRQKQSLHLALQVLQKRTKRNKSIALMLAIVVVVFYVNWTAYSARTFIYFFKPRVKIPCLLY